MPWKNSWLLYIIDVFSSSEIIADPTFWSKSKNMYQQLSYIKGSSSKNEFLVDENGERQH